MAKKIKSFALTISYHMTILDQPQFQTQQFVYASFGERLVARLIDAVILIIPSIFIPLLVPWLYFALLEGSSGGATVGKRAMGIRVVSTEGQPIGFGTATGRFFGQFLNLFTLCFGYLLMLFNARNQCIHDMITSTVVVKDNPVAQTPPTTQRQAQKRSWTHKVNDTETHFVEINAKGGRHWHRTSTGEQVDDFTLWQLTDGLVNFSAEFGPVAAEEMRLFAEQILRNQA
jgi:uncharacterized RDD family membrane protein YckC